MVVFQRVGDINHAAVYQVSAPRRDTLADAPTAHKGKSV